MISFNDRDNCKKVSNLRVMGLKIDCCAPQSADNDVTPGISWQLNGGDITLIETCPGLGAISVSAEQEIHIFLQNNKLEFLI